MADGCLRYIVMIIIGAPSFFLFFIPTPKPSSPLYEALMVISGTILALTAATYTFLSSEINEWVGFYQQKIMDVYSTSSDQDKIHGDTYNTAKEILGEQRGNISHARDAIYLSTGAFLLSVFGLSLFRFLGREVSKGIWSFGVVMIILAGLSIAYLIHKLVQTDFNRIENTLEDMERLS